MCATAATVDTLSTEDTSVPQNERPANVSATSREVIRCRACKLNQFMTHSGNCRRCKVRIKLMKPVERLPEVFAVPRRMAEVRTGVQISFQQRFSLAFWMARIASGLSQRDLAIKASCPRTYVSKVENEGTVMLAKSLNKFCVALGVSEWQFVSLVEALG